MSFLNGDNFRLPTDYSKGRINIALMDAVSVYFDRQSDSFLDTNKNIIINNYYKVLLKDSEFIESVRFSTGSERNVKTRFDKTFQILSQ